MTSLDQVQVNVGSVQMAPLVEPADVHQYAPVPQKESELVIQQPLKEPSLGARALEFLKNTHEFLKNIWGTLRSYISCDEACIEALLLAVEIGDRGLVRGLLFRGVDPSLAGENGGTPLNAAYGKNDVPMVLRLLKKGASPVYTEGAIKQPILCRAIRDASQPKGHERKKMVTALIETGMVDVNDREKAIYMSPLQLAYRTGNFDLMKSLILRGAKLLTEDRPDANVFHLAVHDRRSELALKLLEEGLVKIDPASEEDKIAFVKAMSFRNGNLVKAMIEKGFSVNAEDEKGLTPLYHAFANKNHALALVLAQHGAGYIVCPKEGEVVSLLLQAVKNGWSDVALVLLGNTQKMLDESLARTKARHPENYEEQRAKTQETYLQFRDEETGDTALHVACQKGLKPVVDALLAMGANVNEENNGHTTPLTVALEAGYEAIALALLDKGAKDEGPFPALIGAYRLEQRELVLKLMSRFDINRPNPLQSTLLHHAAADGDLELVKAIMAQGGNAKLQDLSEMTPCQYALTAGHMEVAAFLTSKGGLKNHTDLQKLTQEQYSQFVQALLQMRTVAPMQFLHGALKRNDAVLVNALITACLENPANITKVDKQNVSLANYALMAGDYTRAVQLQRAGSPLNMELIYKLKLKNGPFRQVVMAFITPDPQTSQYTNPQNFIFAAASRDDAVLLKALIAKGADPKAYNAEYMTPMHIAAQQGRVEAVQALIEAGVADDVVTLDTGATPLQFALLNGQVETASYLISRCVNHPAKLEKRDTKGRTALHVAALMGDVHAVEMLLAAGANINAPSASRLTPLHMACAKERYEVAKLLISKGASKEAFDNKGRPPVVFVSENDPAHIRELFQLSPKVHKALQKGRKVLTFLEDVGRELLS